MRSLLRGAARAAALGLWAAGFAGAAQARDDPFTLVKNAADETLAIRDRTVVRAGDIVRFDMISYSPEPVKVRFGRGRSAKTNFELVGIEYNCRAWNIRPVRHGALRASDMSVVGFQDVEEPWSANRTWRPWAAYACSADRSSSTRRRFPDPVAFAAAAPGLRAEAVWLDASRPPQPPRPAWTIDGVDPAACATPELRRAAVGDLDLPVRRKFDGLPPRQRDEGLVQAVNDVCASLMVLQGQDPFAQPDLIPTRYWQVLKRKECQASWDTSCTAPININVPAGFQLCNIGYREDGRGYEYRIEVSPGDWIERSPAPPKFRAYDVKLFASGGGRVFNRTSASIKISDLWVSYFSDKLDNEQRRRRGCQMPAAPLPPQPQPTPAPTPDAPWVQPSFQFPGTSSIERYRVVVSTPANGRLRVRYRVEVFDSLIDNRWERHTDETLDMLPNNRFDKEYHKYHATCWRLRSEYWTGTEWRLGPSHDRRC